MADIFCANLNELRQVSTSGLVNLTEAYIGSLRRKFTFVNNEGGQDDNETTIIPVDSPSSGRWICPSAPLIPTQVQTWNNLNKSGSSLSDLDSKSAADLDSGKLHYLRLPNGVPYFDNASPDLILSTDENGDYKLDKIDVTQLNGLFPFARIDWSSFIPNMIGAESVIYFNPLYFNRDDQNHVSIKLMSSSQPGLAVPGIGIETDEQARINIVYGTGPNQALEGPTPLGGDLSGVHEGAVVDAIRNIPLTFFPNQLVGKDGYVLTLDVKNENTPFFYLSPVQSGGGGSNLPDITNKRGALQTDGHIIYWDLIPQNMIKPTFSILSFNCSVGNVEVGSTVNNPQFTASYNDVPLSVTLSDSNGNSDSISSPFNSFTSSHSFHLTTPSSVVFSISVVDSDNVNHSRNTAISWLPRRYYGHYPQETNFLTLINNLQSSELASGRAGTFLIDCGPTDYIYYVIPSNYGSPVFSVGGFVGGFYQVASNFAFTNAYGITILYNVYRSDNLNLGLTTVSVS